MDQKGRAHPDRPRLRRLATTDLTREEIVAIRDILSTAFGPAEDERFTDDDWDHAVGGVHFVLDVEGDIVTHASVVDRWIQVGDHRLRTGYVEAVATAPDRQGDGFGSKVMTDVTSFIRERYELGALATGRNRFYERLGWETWPGRSSIRTNEGPQPTPDDDGHILVLRTPSTPPLDPDAPISCEWRPGDAW
jgi:aminoglycoside 2'-N-acetyltransferase I